MQVNEIEEMEADLLIYKEKLENAKLVEEFKHSKTYSRIFKDIFLDGYRHTASMNCAKFNIQQTENFVVGMKARAIFESFIDGMLEEKEILEEAVIELSKEIKRLNKT